MSENFASLFEQSVQRRILKPGTIIKGHIIKVDKDFDVVDVGLKSEGIVPKSEFLNQQGELEVTIGDEVDVSLDQVEDGSGETILSREKAKRAEAWEDLIAAYEKKDTIKGLVVHKVKGGLI